MAKHPPCKICRSRRYHRDAVGAFVCESGHLMENYRDEELEAYELGTGGRITFARRLKRIPRARQDEAARLGPGEVRLRVVQGMQHILKLQCHALVQKHSFPEELFGVAKDIWLLCLSSTVLGEASGEDEAEAGDSVNKSNAIKIKAEEEEAQRILLMENQLWKEDEDGDEMHQEDHDLEGERTKGSPATQSEDEEDTTRTSEESDGDEMDERSDEDAGKHPLISPYLGPNESYDPSVVAMGRVATNHPLFQDPWMDEADTEKDEQEPKETDEANQRKRWREKPMVLQLQTTLGVLLLACRWLRCPVLAVDILRWATEGSLPYLDAYTYLPSSLMEGMRWDQLPIFHPTVRTQGKTTPSCTRLRQVAMIIGERLNYRFSIRVQARLNEQALATRLVRMALLPDPFPRYAHELIRLYRQDWADQEERILDEVEIAAAVIVLGKWIYGLDGRERSLKEPPYAQLLPLQQWLRGVQREREEAGPKTLTHCSVQRLALTKPSVFLSLVDHSAFLLASEEKKVVGRTSAKALYSTIRKIPLPSSRDKMIPRSATASPRFHRVGYEKSKEEEEEDIVPCPSSMASVSQDDPTQGDKAPSQPLRPGKAYVLSSPRKRQVWHPDYQTWLSLVGDMVGEDPYALHIKVQRVEMALRFTGSMDH
ncbi:hypothetical protein BJ684DRAFT_19606 [Piptocephalis cylindrospora]|uniref:RRN7-type domain-containing protein n=1 Tax=Piptocephalis cylindrospora TaxID=1907219 RepID=A0A4P9Y551_9FUNG|nr:hypothetical protein BJ684DRAFT_19606 [Piptocephalis cylindrospora]|eukprot:RKP13944.1 hypothetical protein BJ684DRAFT_19606 [Piptocephalis cylindrospora]